MGEPGVCTSEGENRLMIRSLILVVSLAVSGCTANKADAVAPQPEPRPRTPAPVQEKPASAAPKPQANYNPNRIYQLSDLETAQIKFKKETIKVFVMDTASKRQEGMMFLSDKEFKSEDGMLFVFDRSEFRSFWMRNTKLPLDIAYIGETGKVVSVAELKPFEDDPVPSEGAAQFVLEMKKGAFKRLGIAKGSQLTLPKVKSKDTE